MKTHNIFAPTLGCLGQAYCNVKKYLSLHLVTLRMSGFCFMQLNSVSISKKEHDSSPQRPEGLSLEAGLDFLYVARDRGHFRETETGSVRWRENLLAMFLVLGSVEKLMESQSPHPWESLSRNWMVLTGAG